MKWRGREQSKRVIDLRYKGGKPEASIVGQAKRNADEARYHRSVKNVPDKIKRDLDNALAQIRRGHRLDALVNHVAGSKKKQSRLKKGK